MPVSRDPRHGGWIARKVVRLPAGRKVRLFVTPDKFGLANTKAGAEEAERRAIAELLASSSTPSLRNSNPNPTPDGFVVAAPAAPAAKEVPTFTEYAERWLTNSRVLNKPATVLFKEKLVRIATPVFGSLRLDQIDKAMLETWRNELAARYAPKSVNDQLSLLRTLLGAAHEHGLLDRIVKVQRLRLSPPPIDFFDFAEAERLVAAAPRDVRVMIIVALKTGVRIGELSALRWGHVELAARKLRICDNYVLGITQTPKSGKARVVPLSADAVAVLTAWKPASADSKTLVFPTPWDCHWQRPALRRFLAKACRAAGLPPCGWHKLRHTFASHLALRNTPIKTIQELLGHADLRETLRYAHLSPEHLADAVQCLDQPAPGTRPAPPRPATPAATSAPTSSATPLPPAT